MVAFMLKLIMIRQDNIRNREYIVEIGNSLLSYRFFLPNRVKFLAEYIAPQNNCCPVSFVATAAMCCSANVCDTPLKKIIFEILTSQVMVLELETLGGDEVMRVEPLSINEISSTLIKENPESSLSPLNM